MAISASRRFIPIRRESWLAGQAWFVVLREPGRCGWGRKTGVSVSGIAYECDTVHIRMCRVPHSYLSGWGAGD